MDVRNDLLHSLLAGLDAEQQAGLLDRLDRARDEQLLAKRRSAGDAESAAD